jgi:hypothetical protein
MSMVLVGETALFAEILNYTIITDYDYRTWKY